MPQLRTINTSQAPKDKPEPSGVQEFFSKLSKDYTDRKDKAEIDNIISGYQQNRNDENALEDLFLNIEKSNMGPTKRIEATQRIKEGQAVVAARDKALNAKMNKTMLNDKDKPLLKQALINDGYPEQEAELYVNSPPGVQNTLARGHAAEKGRNKRQPITQSPQSPATIANESSEVPILDVEKEEVWPVLPPPENMNDAERIKWGNENQKANTKKLEEVEKKKKGYQQNDQLIQSMTRINESKKLPEGIGKAIVVDPDTGTIRPTAQLLGQINPETELYVKNLNQFLKGAKEFFGARVTDFDVRAFMAQLPSLMNSEQGRRVILKQMELVNRLEQVGNTELDEGIKHYGRNANYIDISKTVDSRLKEKEPALISQINNVIKGSDFLTRMSKNPEKFKDAVLMEKNGEFKAVRKQDIPRAEVDKWRTF